MENALKFTQETVLHGAAVVKSVLISLARGKVRQLQTNAAAVNLDRALAGIQTAGQAQSAADRTAMAA